MPTIRPFIQNLSASPSPFAPLAGQSTTLSYSLADDVSSIATVTVKVYDSQNALVRTLVNGSQAVGAQSVAWDGKNDAGAILPTGSYTVKVNATDGTSLAAPEQTLSVALTRQASTTYGYDRLYRLASVAAPSGPTGYEYDSVGNRTTMTRGSATGYSYDRADRITTAGTVSYSVNANGNLVARGPDTFGYDQANRLKTATLGSTTSTYGYDGDGKRVSATVGTNPTVTYRYDVNRSLPVVLDDGTRKYVWGLGLAYAVDNGGNVEVYHASHRRLSRDATAAPISMPTAAPSATASAAPTSTRAATTRFVPRATAPWSTRREQASPDQGIRQGTRQERWCVIIMAKNVIIMGQIMVRTQIQLTEEQARALKALAASSGLSMAELVRRGLDQLLRSAGAVDDERRRRAMAAAGRFHSGRSDISAEHDRYLVED